jgi:hypothetical protein
MEKAAGDQKDRAKAPDPAKRAKDLKGAAALDPCAKPQATEAERQKDADDACDDGVK